ncbi:hypothetical protein ACFL6L_01680 [candidate division KSB1 bacterium]
MYGGRFAYGISERLLIFTDVGRYSTEYADPEIMAQPGIRYTLPVDLPLDLAVRSTVIPYVASYEHYIELTLSLLASRYLDTASIWAVYGSVGVDYQQWELKLALDPMLAALTGQDTYIDKGDKTDAIFALGASRKLTDAACLFVEIAHVDDFFSSAGIRLDL